ncbi:hypothetical protein MJA45_17280 [Paenibacillus aurantius]|uniref:Uncharacterized protein n=1 Tax=Paenibacillus aurantius TaxID=2918900 RepID=A0AA96L9W3_9BACL|nr:hypothetical protein [Paenibacillus aurantius]WJH34273.1 hypothetical protein N6H14_31070 [Paenibacillus sp. CC-CFT747]WNQ09378.1 hypothetical protein MJA45_17280 [Paenibacillus aurantius]
MPYQPKVAEAKIVSHNEKNGLMEVVVVLEDRNHCRVTYETLPSGEKVPTDISRLHKEPCPVCKKDYLCNCMDPYLPEIGEQVSKFVDLG